MTANVLTAVSAAKMTQEQLKAELVKLGLKSTGTKEELLVTILEHLEKTTKPSVKSPTSPSALEAKKKERALRFGIETPAVAPAATKPTPKVLPKGPVSVSVEEDLIAKRKAKFGEVEVTEKATKKQKPAKNTEAASATATAAPAPATKKEKAKAPKAKVNPANVTVQVDEETARKRAERFATQ